MGKKEKSKELMVSRFPLPVHTKVSALLASNVHPCSTVHICFLKPARERIMNARWKEM